MKSLTVFALLISYALILFIWKSNKKIKLFENPLIFAYAITLIYISKFLLFGLTYNVDPDLPQFYYPIVETLLDGNNPLNGEVYYNGGILWILILTIPSLLYNSVI